MQISGTFRSSNSDTRARHNVIKKGRHNESRDYKGVSANASAAGLVQFGLCDLGPIGDIPSVALFSGARDLVCIATAFRLKPHALDVHLSLFAGMSLSVSEEGSPQAKS